MYKASPDLSRQVNPFKRKMMAVSIFRTAIIFIFAVIFYPHFKSVDIGAIVLFLTLFVGVNLISYSQIVSSISIINTTVQEVLIDGKSIQAKTVGFKIFFIKKEEKHLNFRIDISKIREADFPLNKLFGTKITSIKVLDEENECYILPDFFDRELLENLTKNI